MRPEVMQVAAQLKDREYGHEITADEEIMLKKQGLVIVFGYSDDNAELRGAISEEIGCYEGTKIYLTSEGLLVNECESDSCPHFAKLRESAATITVESFNRDFTFTYETEIPHAKFIITEDGENYCEGIVFALADVKAPG